LHRPAKLDASLALAPVAAGVCGRAPPGRPNDDGKLLKSLVSPDGIEPSTP
jgi:hypothetical protein